MVNNDEYNKTGHPAPPPFVRREKPPEQESEQSEPNPACVSLVVSVVNIALLIFEYLFVSGYAYPVLQTIAVCLCAVHSFLFCTFASLALGVLPILLIISYYEKRISAGIKPKPSLLARDIVFTVISTLINGIALVLQYFTVIDEFF